jgi:hypothetical protein
MVAGGSEPMEAAATGTFLQTPDGKTMAEGRCAAGQFRL